jgi:hypothetical protein
MPPHGLNPQRATIPAVGHDRGLHRGVPHGFGQRREAHPPLSQKARHGGFARPRHNHVVAGEHSDHSGDDNDSNVASGVTARHQPPVQATTRSSGREASTSPRSATLCQVGGGTMAK